jgi:hypothetical protein
MKLSVPVLGAALAFADGALAHCTGSPASYISIERDTNKLFLLLTVARSLHKPNP